jgi:hypothetical protein
LADIFPQQLLCNKKTGKWEIGVHCNAISLCEQCVCVMFTPQPPPLFSRAAKYELAKAEVARAEIAAPEVARAEIAAPEVARAEIDAPEVASPEDA